MQTLADQPAAGAATHPLWCRCDHEDGEPHASESTTVSASPTGTVSVRLVQHPGDEKPAVEIAQFAENPRTGVEQTTITIPVSAARHMIRAVAHAMWSAAGVTP